MSPLYSYQTNVSPLILPNQNCVSPIVLRNHVSPITLTNQKNYVSPILLSNQNYVSPLYSVKVLMLLLSTREHMTLIELLQTCIYVTISFQKPVESKLSTS